ncbi:MAG: UDP-N-acetylmuramoyl-tripeptide--D-alanyl-D-alanine ligase [Alphaproteobacteria bacterium]|nr:UDP-N-acetylmuramoyl-tripeptide--D-alanyl-D-alanine ligase [Alphaproteobacteria bacterium]
MTEDLWTAHEVEAAVSGRRIGEWRVSGVSIDTRTLSPGDLFVALRDIRDGHDFVDTAFSAGAAACLVSRDVGRPGLISGDVLEALVQLGSASRRRMSGVCAAVTGSVGKTSVKEMIARIFRAHGRSHWSDKSFNNHWGVPLTLARMPRDTQRAIFEIGMSTPGEIAPRSRLVRPHIAMITCIAPAHLEGLGSVDAVAGEKSDIFAGLEPDGVVILPERDSFFETLRRRAFDLQPSAEVLTFGGDPGVHSAGVRDYDSDGARSLIRLEVLGAVVETELLAVGEHWAANAALAVLAAVASGIDARSAAQALSGYSPPPGRGTAETLQLATGDPITLVDDSYNANPQSMRAAFSGLARRPGRKVAVLGEMRELGEESAEWHSGLAEPLIAAGVSVVILSGGEMRHLAARLIREAPSIEVRMTHGPEEAAATMNSLLLSGDVVLIKGSNASGMGKVATILRAIDKGVDQDASSGRIADAL